MPTTSPATSTAAALTSAPLRTLAQNSRYASTSRTIATMWTAKPRFSPKISAAVLSPAAMSATLRAAARIMLPSNSSQAIRLRAVSAAASRASTNDQAMLVSGKLNR
ncbi:hypothetical protein PICSAR181_01479 [Mycobacterium avium subsp. paratuberculosis]|nr:hypothetical protein PICSAR14_04133 [Mycobacterium avium subsp. paratuberculosis]CAG7038129.1 hypothetical protein PICSAR179_00956 [Mycobacterium avium subsp. paratuberculosis]CAG7048075.1 hypothetical protein PICSAR181_01479 [Mycobacterium avium subsp. paratuberculosis]CAG7240428.1 hypothetical protein PICSAR26_02830 [Mycobacterium avium subsp. paratuberculosis]CAG7385612.1 hypothetical protein PICSAR7_03538 [Mycobacterium avium subsp. paratuberculosis]